MKKQKMHTGMFLFIGLLLLTTNVFSQDPNFHIYLCFGQSNMEGQGTIEAIDMITWPKEFIYIRLRLKSSLQARK